MELVADGVSVAGPHAPLLAATSLTVTSGAVTTVTGLPGAGHTALALVLAGRLVPDRGRVSLDGDEDPRVRRESVAVVDVPGVSEPEEVLALRTVVGEELAMAGRSAGPRHVVEWLTARGAADHTDTRWEHVPAHVRLPLLLELASERPGVGALVLCTPDRHGGHPATWWSAVRAVADRDLAVVVSCLDVSAWALGLDPARLGGAATPVPEGEPSP